MNKRGYITISMMLVILAFALLAVVIFSHQTSALKANRYLSENSTCEQFTDTVLWSALGQKNAVTYTYYNWTRTNPCPGTKSCDTTSIWVNVRYTNLGSKTEGALNATAYSQIANTSQTNNATVPWANLRYSAVLNQTILIGDSLGPRYECGANGTATQPSTCNTIGQGFDNSTANYSIRLFANGASNGAYRLLIDEFNARYTWCWTPIIYDATVSPES